MLKNHLFQQSLRTSASQVSLSIYEEEFARDPPQMIRQNKFTKTYAKLTCIPLQLHVPTLITRNIQHLYISHNNISSLIGIENYPNLVSLNVSYNRLKLIQELKLIQNPDYLLRIGLRMNDFVYGYQDYAIKLLGNLQKIDDICVKDKIKVKEMWERGEKIGSDFLQFYIRLERVLNFMNDLIGKIKLHHQMGLSQGKSKYPNPQLKLLFEHMTQNFIAQVSQNYLLPSEQQFLHLTSLEILKKTQKIISITLQQKIDLKCTCRPKLPYDGEVKNTFQQISKKFLLKFSNRFNRELQNGIKKVKMNLCQFYPDRKWQRWQLYGMLQNYLELGVGGKRLSHIVDQERKKFSLFNDVQNTQINILKGKKPKKQDISWRNAIFSDLSQRNEDEKENQSPNITYLLQNFGHHKISAKKKARKQQQNKKPQPQLFFDRIPMILYEKNYVEILMEITMNKIGEMLDKYDYLVQTQKESIHFHIKQLELKEKIKKPSFDQKIQLIKKTSQLSTKRRQSIQNTQRNIEDKNNSKRQKSSKQQKMLKSTIVNNTPLNTQRDDEEAVTTTRHYLKRKDSQISFGKTNQDENQNKLVRFDSNEQEQKKKKTKSKQNNSAQQDNVKSSQNYSLHEINLAYKVFRGLKLRILKRKKKAKLLQK